MSIETKTSEFNNLTSIFALSDSLLGGTRAMRAAGTTYLPKMAAEESDDYKKKLQASVLYPAYAETIKQMLGRVFFKAVERKDIKIDQGYLEDFDLGGNDLDAFLIEPFKHALAYSRAYVLITAPDGSEAVTKEQEKALNIRPYAVTIHPNQVLGIKRDNGEITEFRYATTETVINENYEESTLKKVIVHQRGLVSIYVETSDGYILSEEYKVKASGNPYPVVPVAELMLEDGELPLEHLAWLNIKHWCVMSDMDNLLKFFGIPIFAAYGIDPSSKLTVGAAINVFDNESAKLEMVEGSGGGLDALQKRIDGLEAQMQAAGAKLLTRTKLSMTDSQAKEEQSKEISTLRRYANQLEDFAEKLLYFYALFEGKDEGGRIEISGNIDADFDMSASMDRVDQGVRNGYVSPQTAYEELQRRGMISANNDWEAEQTRLDAQNDQATTI